jgi:hypothetical protein
MPGNLADRCQRAFSKRSWNAGVAYHRWHRVKIDEPSDDHGISARVAGNQNGYIVTLDWSSTKDDRMLAATCSCPHFADGYMCKHLAAAILQADSQQIGQRVPGEGELELVDGEEYIEDGEEIDDISVWADDEELEYGGSSRRWQPVSLRKRASAKGKRQRNRSGQATSNRWPSTWGWRRNRSPGRSMCRSSV